MTKLLNSKWTATSPKNKEKHFIITKVFYNEEDTQVIDRIFIEAVFTKKSYEISAQELKNSEFWLRGWK